MAQRVKAVGHLGCGQAQGLSDHKAVVKPWDYQAVLGPVLGH